MSLVQFKVITPKNIKIDAMRRELTRPVQLTVIDANKEFAKTYATFQNKPAFRMELKQLKGRIRGSTTTTATGSKNNPYPFVQRGTKRHFIRPVRAKALRFQTGYRPKSRVGNLSTVSGGSFGPVAYSKGHYVSGITARNSERIIRTIERPRFVKRTVRAMRQVAKVSGQAI